FIDEDHPQRPVNPYGWSKLMTEQMIRDYGRAYGLNAVVLRYFNAAGASVDSLLGEQRVEESHLIPLALQAAAGLRPRLSIFGDDYPTPDGTCVRDYVHVEDLASAHVAAAEHLHRGGASGTYNIGLGVGRSVREVIDCCRHVTGRTIDAVVHPRRPGDPPQLVASGNRITDAFGWTPRHVELPSIVESAWKWLLTGGYANRGAARRAA
ncbi:MAG: NAD-dependent epimerase/dehydratase family protein, partial [Planctomycetia bacterium]